MSVFKKKATVKTFSFELTNISKLWWHVISKTQEFDKFTEKWINYLQKSANYTDICFLIRYLISDIGYLQKICKIYIILICKRYPLYDYLLLFYRYRYTTPIYLLSVICKKNHIVCFLWAVQVYSGSQFVSLSGFLCLFIFENHFKLQLVCWLVLQLVCQTVGLFLENFIFKLAVCGKYSVKQWRTLISKFFMLSTL